MRERRTFDRGPRVLNASRSPRRWRPRLAGTVLIACLAVFGPLSRSDRATAQPPDLSAGCADWLQGESLEEQARKAAAVGEPQQYEFWGNAARAAQGCENAAASAQARDWFTYLNAADTFMSLGSESELIAGAPAVLAELDGLTQTAQQPALERAALALRGDVALAYRQTRAIVSARATPVLAPEPTISPILLRGGDHMSRRR